MALEPQIVDLPPLAGTSEDGGKYVPTQGAHVMDNWVFFRTGELVKRAGYGLLSAARTDGDPLPPPSRVMARGDELVMVGDETELPSPGPTLYSYAPVLGQWAPRGPAVGLSVLRRRVIARPPTDSLDQAPQVARAGGMECVLTLVGGVAKVEVRDTATGALVLTAGIASTGKVVLLVTNGLFRFVWVSGTSLSTAFCSPGAPGISATSGVATIAAAPLYWDAVATTGGAWVWAGVRSTGTTLDVQRATGGTASSATTVTTTGSGRCALAYSGSVVMLAYDQGATGLYARTYVESTLAAGVAPFLARPAASYFLLFALACIVAPDGTLLVASTTAVTDANFSAPPFCSWFDAFSATGTTLGASQPRVWDVALGSRPFALGQTVYCAVHGNPGPQGPTATINRIFGYAVLNLTRNRSLWHPATAPILVEANIAPTDGRGMLVQLVGEAIGVHLTLPPVSDPLVYLPIVVFRGNDSIAAGGSAVADVIELSADPGTEPLAAQVEAQGALVMGGALPSIYDGLGAFEAAFLQPPEIVNVSLDHYDSTFGVDVAPAPGNRYEYIAIYQVRDKLGQVHRSRPSAPVGYTITGTGTGVQTYAYLKVVVRCTALSRHPAGDVQIVLYRTYKNAPSSHYELRNYSAGTLLMNDPTAAAVVFTDNQSDANLQAITRPQLYTDGGVLENDAPPPARHLARHGGRLWLVSAERREVWFSRYLIEGEAPCWSIVNRITLDDSDSPPVATFGQDGAVGILTETQCYATGGAGPNDTGLPPFPPPDRLQVARGCLDSRSVVSTRDGTLFDAPEGIVMLSRKLELVPIGRPVERTLASIREFGSCRGASHDAARDRVIWLYPGEGSSTRALVYDVALATWTTWTWEGQRVVGHTLWQGGHTLAHGAGVALEASGTAPGYDPGDIWVTSTLESPWLRAGALGGYQRLWRMHLQVERLSLHGLIWQLYTDGDDVTPAQTEVWTETELSALPTSPRAPLVIGVAPQKSATFKFRLTDSPPALTTSAAPAGFTYHGASLQVGAKKGLWKGARENVR